jgi:uncharacterized protein YndB with AHSA1/START domain
MLKWVLLLVGLLAALILFPMIGGMFLPRGHTATSTITLAHPIDSVWGVVSNLTAYPSWWRDVKSMERIEDEAGGVSWLQRDAQGQELPIELQVSDPPDRLVTRIADDRLPFGGTWTYELESAPSGCRVTVTEEGEIFNPVFRVVARYILGYHGTVDRYLRALGARFGDTVVPTHVR